MFNFNPWVMSFVDFKVEYYHHNKSKFTKAKKADHEYMFKSAYQDAMLHCYHEGFIDLDSEMHKDAKVALIKGLAAEKEAAIQSQLNSSGAYTWNSIKTKEDLKGLEYVYCIKEDKYLVIVTAFDYNVEVFHFEMGYLKLPFKAIQKLSYLDLRKRFINNEQEAE